MPGCSNKATKADSQSSTAVPTRSVIMLLAASLTTAVIVELMLYYRSESWGNSNNATTEFIARSPTYAIFSKSESEDHLVHVKTLLHKFGYKRVDIDSDWNLLWAHDYPYANFISLKSLSANQLVNHFPGCGYLTNKVDLSTNTKRLTFLPQAFRLPEQSELFLQYARSFPDKLFVQKHNEHRGIKIKAFRDVELNMSDSFVQEFLQNPFLVDGYKFDIGVYVVITSVNPLRAYIYTGDVLFRYCPKKYHPFDAEDINKYIVGDDYLPTWEVPSLRKYYTNFGASMRDAFEAYVRDQSMDPAGIWLQVEHILRTTIQEKEKDIFDTFRSYKTHNFFELMRFDFFIDANLNVYLMEANMSPNLSSAHFKSNSILYNQVLYSVFSLVGIRPVSSHDYTNFMSAEVNDITDDKNLATGLNKCAKYKCDKSCNQENCNLCLPCLSGSDYEIIKKAHREHLHRADMKRIFPKEIANYRDFNFTSETKNMTRKNAWMTQWYAYKCEYDRTWCS
ncbi:tubulin polyglutamylase TTLL4 [Scaptodrosophila lebanonensis]|uniref:Tubulin polyglutamylase TTLL4 n=1 Tax=Drosophila lebanonensis TaxID=7225 RepID=A0A6J2U430_DROLE|nr:tubulin polyglutamylase TTLL4 [Scaptodrosophila lebanonensis]